MREPHIRLLRVDSFDHLETIISCRETLFSSLSRNIIFQDLTKVSVRDARTMEARALLSSSQMSRRHGALQNALAVTTYLSRLVQPCEDLGIDISAALQLESAGVLWDQGEMAASINILQDLKATADLGKQAIHVGKPELLARLVRRCVLSVNSIPAHGILGSSNLRGQAREA